MPRSARSRLTYGSYVLRRPRLIYVETPKVACTSFKHLVGSLGGIDARDMHWSRSAEKTDAMTIHDRALMPIPSLVQLSEEEREEVLSSPEYLRFCVVRNPYARIAGAWADRFLCHSLNISAPILRQIGFPDYRPDMAYLRSAFSEFVTYIYASEAPRFSNHHWNCMTNLLLPDLVNYNSVMKLEHLSQSLSRLIDHVEAQGIVWPGLPRVNETLVTLGLALYTPATARKIREIYHSDFRAFGYSDRLDIPAGSAVSLPDSELIRGIQERNRRISYLSNCATGK